MTSTATDLAEVPETLLALAPPPFNFDDERLFSGRKIHQVRLDVTWDRRLPVDTDGLIVTGITDRGERVEILFSGDREDLFRDGLGKVLHRAWVEMFTAYQAGDLEKMPDAYDVAGSIVADGAWKPRVTKDASGKVQNKTWTFIPAKWSYSSDPMHAEPDIDEGWLPAAA